MSRTEGAKERMLFNLQVLSDARKRLIDDFFGKDDEIYKSMFKYERRGQETLRELSIEKYFIVWLVRHKEMKDNLLKKYQIVPVIQHEIEKSFNRVFLQLIQKIEGVHETMHHTTLLEELVTRKIAVLENFLCVGDKINKEMESFIYNYERDKALYERKIRELEEKPQ